MANEIKSSPSYLEDLIFPNEIKSKLIEDNNCSLVTIVITGFYEKKGYDKLINILRKKDYYPILKTDFGKYIIRGWETECLSELNEIVRYSFKFIGYEPEGLEQ